MKKLIAVGKVVRTWGIKGDVKIDLVSGRIQKLSVFQELFAGIHADNVRSISLERERVLKLQIIAKFGDIDSIEEAELFRGSYIFVKAEELGSLREDEYYISDLIGLKVVLEDGKDIGTVKDVVETGGTDILLVEKDDREMLIPLSRTICRSIDTGKGIIIVRPLEGLLELNEV